MYSTERVLGFIPARGGSKGVPKKNIKTLGGRPLLTHVAEAGKRSPSISKVLCSTDNEEIKSVCAAWEIEVDNRPFYLAKDQSPIVETLIEFIGRVRDSLEVVPQYIALLQPTSPFILTEHIEECIDKIKENPNSASCQTVVKIPHHQHAYNQREIVEGHVEFKFERERRIYYNKQKKPDFYSLGNFVIVKSSELIKQRAVFAEPSLPVEISPKFAHDIDKEEDFVIGECYIKKGLVSLPWL